jgi:general secretion pathway protein M
MTLQERLDKLEPRERRLLNIFGGLIAAVLLLLLPFALFSMVSSRRSENQEIRDLVQSIYEAEGRMSERKARHDALLSRYAKPAPQLAAFVEEAAKKQGLAAAESQDRPDVPHGKRYTERVTVVKMHKIGMLPLAKMLESIETSGHPLAITRLNLKPRAGEPDSYEVELGLSAFDRKADPAASPSSAASAQAAPESEDAETEK